MRLHETLWRGEEFVAQGGVLMGEQGGLIEEREVCGAGEPIRDPGGGLMGAGEGGSLWDPIVEQGCLVSICWGWKGQAEA